MRALLLLLAACKGPVSATDPPAGFVGTAFEGVAETGVLLGIFSAGDEALLVGGDLGGNGRITHYDGQGFCVEPVELEHTLWWIHGRSPTDWYAVGERGIILHESAGTRTREDVQTLATLFGVYDDGTDVWAVGGDVLNTQQGQIWRKPTGGEWALFLDEIDGLMFKVHDGWFVGEGQAFYWDGSTLEERHPPILPDETRAPKLLTVRSFGPDRAIAVGGTSRATVLSYHAGTWTAIDVPPECAGGQGLNGIFGDTADTVSIAGHRGAASLLENTTWTCETPTDEHFHVVWKHLGEVLYAGGNLFDFGENHGTVAIAPDRGPLPVTTCP